MPDRVFRLSITPLRAPEVRRVVDFDGRSTLHDVHDAIQHHLELDNDHLYAFYLSGDFFDRASEHGISDDAAHDSSQSRLFRLGLEPGRKLAYLFDFGDEHRHEITVVSITDVDKPLLEPVLVESVGDAPAQYDEGDEGEPYELPEYLEEVAPLAEVVLDLSEQLDVLLEEYDAEHESDESLEPEAPPENIRALTLELSKAVLALASALEGDEQAALDLDAWSDERELLPRIANLPSLLASVRELDSALAVAKAFRFVAEESFDGDVAIILAESGKRDEAMQQLEANLAKFPQSFLTAYKAGAAYEALEDTQSAEASYRRAIELAEGDEDEDEARSELAGLLDDLGRHEEAEHLLNAPYEVDVRAALEDEARILATMPPPAKAQPSVGRNDPCLCGSGKKYKKCHGA